MVTLAEQTLPNHERLLNFLSKENPDVLKLFHVFLANQFSSEAEAIEKAKVGERTKFRQVARELMRCLEQMVLHIGFERQTLEELSHNRIRGFQVAAMSKTLGLLARKISGKRAAEELLKIGLQYARPDFVVDATKSLLDYVSVMGSDLKEYEAYIQLYEEFAQWRMLEDKAMFYHDRVKIPLTRKKSLQREYIDIAKRYLAELEPFVGVAKSHNFHLCYYSLKSYRFLVDTKYREASLVHEEAIDYFNARPYPCTGTLSIFHYLEIATSVYMGRYKRGEEHFQKAIDSASAGSVNWYNTLEMGFYLRMHSRDYIGAANLFAMATKNKRFVTLREIQRETWFILGAYLFLMQRLTDCEIPENLIPKYRSNKFRNDIKDFTRDKMGMNIAILAAEVLLHFVEGRDEELWDRMAALEKYRERYLRNNTDTHRSQLFIKILAILSRYHHDREKFLEKAEPYLVEMKASPLQISNQAHELEIVPYEHLVQAIAFRLGPQYSPSFSANNLPEAARAVMR